MSAFSPEQRKELEELINAAIAINTRSASAYTNSRVKAAIEEERERLARIVETCEPFTDFIADATSGIQDETPDLAATLHALGRAIRTGSHE